MEDGLRKEIANSAEAAEQKRIEEQEELKKMDAVALLDFIDVKLSIIRQPIILKQPYITANLLKAPTDSLIAAIENFRANLEKLSLEFQTKEEEISQMKIDMSKM